MSYRRLLRTPFFATRPLRNAWRLDGHPFSQRERDFESPILDLDFSVLHRAFGAMDPMVRRTVGFRETKSGFETT